MTDASGPCPGEGAAEPAPDHGTEPTPDEATPDEPTPDEAGGGGATEAPSPELVRRATRVLALPIAVVVAVTGWALVTSPVLRGDPGTEGPSEPPPTTRPDAGLPPPTGEARIGEWEDEPRCEDDPTGDVQVRPYDRPVAEPERAGGSGDLTVICGHYGERLAVEARVTEPVDQQLADADDAVFQVNLDVDENTTPDLQLVVQRFGDEVVAVVRENEITSPRCSAAAAWRDEVVRVDVDPTCFGEPTRVGLDAILHHYDVDDFTVHDDFLPGAGTAEGRGPLGFDQVVRLPRHGGPPRGFASPEAAIASVTGTEYTGACAQPPPADGSDRRVCSYFEVALGEDRIFALGAELQFTQVRHRMLLRVDDRGGWTVVDTEVEADQVPPGPGCPSEDPGCVAGGPAGA